MNIRTMSFSQGHNPTKRATKEQSPSQQNLTDSVTLGNQSVQPQLIDPKSFPKASPKSDRLSPEEQQAWRNKLGEEPIGAGESEPGRVTELKNLLNQRELVNLPEDDDYDLFTENVVKGAQLRRGLPQTGVFDIRTREAILSGDKRDPLNLTPAEKAMWNEKLGSKTLRRGGSNNKTHVTNLQDFLNERELETVFVDGDFGPETEQALKAAQRRHGLNPSGVFDLQTKTTLLDAAKKIVDKTGSHDTVKARIQEVLLAEHKRFGEQQIAESGRVTKRGAREFESGYDKRIGDYWKSIGLSYDGDDRSVPWSAAFISFAHRIAGVGDQFKAGPAHASYIRDSIFAKKEGRGEAAYIGHRSSERAPQVGDLIGRARQRGVDYDNQPKSYKSHTDLVVDVGPGYVKMIGGNVADSVSMVTLSTDENGFLNNQSKYFVVMEPNNLAGDDYEPPTEQPNS